MMEQLQSGKLKSYVLVHEHVWVKPQIDDAQYEQYTLVDKAKALSDLNDLYESGVTTLIDMTPINYGRSINTMSELARQSGVSILPISGFHKDEFLSIEHKRMDVDQLERVILRDLAQFNFKQCALKFGTSYNEVKASEKRCIEAVCRVHLKTGIPISTHCDKGTCALEQLELLKKYGVDYEHVLLGHIDMSENESVIYELLKQGVNLGFDHIGRTQAHDDWLVQLVSKLVKDGFIHQICISQDFGKTSYLHSYGGQPGLDYIVKDFKELFLKHMDIKIFDQIMIENPCRIFKLNE